MNVSCLKILSVYLLLLISVTVNALEIRNMPQQSTHATVKVLRKIITEGICQYKANVFVFEHFPINQELIMLSSRLYQSQELDVA
jgi:hypothetical protein